MKLRLGIRGRVALWFAVLSSGLVLIFSIAIYIGVWQSTLSGVDRELSVRAEALFDRCSWGADGVVFDAMPPGESVLGGLKNLRSAEVDVWPGGRVLLQHGVPSGEPAVAPSEPTDSNYTLRYRTREDEDEAPGGREEDFDERVCVLVAPLKDGPPHTLVRVRIASDIEPLEDQLEALLPLLVLLDVVFVAAGALLGGYLANRIVKPIVELRGAAVRAREGDRGQLPHQGNGDEIDELSKVLSESFGALNAALERQVRFTADAAHELRNPISALMNTAEVALMRDRDPAASRELFQSVLTESRRMADVLEALLTLARCDRGEARMTFAPLDLGLIARDVVREWKEQGEEVPVEVHGTAPLSGEPVMIKVLLSNLVKNAARYSPPGEAVHVDLSVEDGITVLEVSDRGVGIREDQRSLVFERFYRGTDDLQGGTAGLGLSIVKAIVELHGGEVEAADAAPGTVIRMKFSPSKLSLDDD